MNIVIIPEDITEKELDARKKELHPLEEPKPKNPRGWEVYWKNREPKISYDSPPLITPEQIKEFREKRGWYQRHLAIRTGYNTNTIKHMESGEYKIPPMLSSMIHLMMEVDELKAKLEERDKKLALLGYAPVPIPPPKPKEGT